MTFGVLIAGLLISFISSCVAERKMDIELQNVRHYIHDNDVIQHVELGVGKYKKHKTFHLEITFRIPIDTFEVKLRIFTPRQKLPIVKVTWDGCDCLRTDGDRPQLVEVIINAVHDGSKLPKQCPIAANDPLIVERFYLNPKHFPMQIPEMIIHANFTITFKKKPVLSLSVNYEFKKV